MLPRPSVNHLFNAIPLQFFKTKTCGTKIKDCVVPAKCARSSPCSFVFNPCSLMSLLLLRHPLLHPCRVVLYILKPMGGQKGLSDGRAVTTLTMDDNLLIRAELIQMIQESPDEYMFG